MSVGVKLYVPEDCSCVKEYLWKYRIEEDGGVWGLVQSSIEEGKRG